MKVNLDVMTKAEVAQLRRLLQSKLGNVTVKDAREFFTIGKWGTVGFAVFAMILVFAIGLILAVFVPPIGAIVMFSALAMPFYAPFKVRNDNKRWAAILPAQNDGDLVEIS